MELDLSTILNFHKSANLYSVRLYIWMAYNVSIKDDLDSYLFGQRGEYA